MAWVTAYDRAGKAHKVDDAEFKSRYAALGWSLSKPAAKAKASAPASKPVTAQAQAQTASKPVTAQAKPAARPSIKIGRK